MINKHPNAELLVEYTSGTLSTAPAIAITTHLHFCDTCSHLTQSLAEIGSQFLNESEREPISEDLFEKVLACLDDSSDINDSIARQAQPSTDDMVQTLPRYVQNLLPDSLLWRSLSPSLKTAAISIGEQVHEVALHKIKARGSAPEHNHRGREITVVLKGNFSDQDGVYNPGDFIVREIGEVHQPFATQDDECICLSVLEGPIKLTGINRIFNPFLSFSPS